MIKKSIIISLIISVLLIILIVWMIKRLKNNLKKTLYLFENIELSAGILFVGIFTGILLIDSAVKLINFKSLSPSFIFKMMLAFPRDFSYFALFFLTVIFVLLFISNVALIRHEGFRPKNALGIALGLAYILGTVLLYKISDLLFVNVVLPFGLAENKLFVTLYTFIPTFLLLCLCYFECILAGTAFLGYLAARQKPEYDKDFIIIPGCSISKTGGLLPLLKGRANRAVRYAWDQEIACGKPVKYIPSGGQGPDEIMSEASAMELYLLSHGAESYEVFPEKESRTTFENFRNSKRIIDGLDPEAKVAFATTNYHMLRCGLLAKAAGLDAEGIASDTKWYFWPNGFVREFIAILNMHKVKHLVAVMILAVICEVFAMLSMLL